MFFNKISFSVNYEGVEVKASLDVKSGAIDIAGKYQIRPGDIHTDIPITKIKRNQLVELRKKGFKVDVDNYMNSLVIRPLKVNK